GPEKTQLSIDIAKREKRILQNIDYENGYSMYIGIPFCPTTCLYCSFTSYPFGKWAKRADEYVEAVEKEIKWTAEAFKDKKLNTVYFGGGTPTTLTAAQLDRLLTCVEEHFDFSYLQEYTVEAGRPDSITREKLEVLKKHNVGRISINPQTMKQETLNLIGRHHTVEQIKEVYAMARELGFDNINMDLILGLPGETIDDVRNTMAELKEMAPDNITVHSLAIKRAARLNIFWEKYAHMSMENSDDTMAVAAAAAEELGLKPYYLYRQKNMAGNLENVGYAAEGKEGIYNILIMEEKQSIVAIGAGATTKAVYQDGRIERANNVKDVELYLQQVDEMIERKKKLFADFL
ncbi:MAG: coproporphyrinogen dehydrogenase HemZ, partial [Lachnospiraceae bacterium]|nr:coproporphyrinogen dehydrogenase HemZ [Lachnospiraceae bacterium]